MERAVYVRSMCVGCAGRRRRRKKVERGVALLRPPIILKKILDRTRSLHSPAATQRRAQMHKLQIAPHLASAVLGDLTEGGRRRRAPFVVALFFFARKRERAAAAGRLSVCGVWSCSCRCSLVLCTLVLGLLGSCCLCTTHVCASFVSCICNCVVPPRCNYGSIMGQRGATHSSVPLPHLLRSSSLPMTMTPSLRGR